MSLIFTYVRMVLLAFTGIISSDTVFVQINTYSDAGKGILNPTKNHGAVDFKGTAMVDFGTIRGWSADNKSNKIEWNVKRETGVDHYEIEKLQSRDVYSIIGMQQPRNHNLDTTYIFLDNAPKPEYNFYRIKAIELTGEVTYSDVISIWNGANGSTAPGLKVYPNPVNGNLLTVSFQHLKAGKYNLKISNTNGQVIYSISMEHNGGNTIQQVPMSKTMSKGIYYIRVINNETVLTSSFVRE